MKILFSIITGTALTIASSAIAQSPAGPPFTDGFYIDGYIDLSYFESESINADTLIADIDMGYRPSAGLSGLPLGISLGIDGISINTSSFGSNTRTALYPAVMLGLGNHIFSAGIPRSVIDQGYLSEHIFAQSSYMEFELGSNFDSATKLGYLLFDNTPYGLRWDGNLGSVKVGASWHRFSVGSNDTDIYALAFRHEMDVISSFPKLAFFGGLEYIELGGGSLSNYQVGLEGGSEKFMAGLVYKTGDTLLGSSDSATRAYVEYYIGDNLKVDASVVNIGSQTPYGVGIEYKFLNNAYTNLTFANTGNSTNDTIWEASVGWKF